MAMKCCPIAALFLAIAVQPYLEKACAVHADVEVLPSGIARSAEPNHHLRREPEWRVKEDEAFYTTQSVLLVHDVHSGGDSNSASSSSTVAPSTSSATSLSGSPSAADEPYTNEERALMKLGEQRNRSEMSPWLMVTITLIEAIILVGCFYKLTGLCVTSRNVAIPDDPDELREQLEQSKRKVAELEASLDEAVRTELPAAGESDAADEGDNRGRNPLKKKAREVTRKQAMKLAAKSEAARKALEEGILTMRERAEALAVQESKKVCEVVQAAVEKESTPKDILGKWIPTSDKDEDPFRLPPLHLLLWGVVSPALLKTLHRRMMFMMAWDAVLFIASMLALFLDWRRTCKDTWVWVWFYGITLAVGLDMLCSFYLYRNSGTAMQDIEEAEMMRKAREQHTENKYMDVVVNFAKDGGHHFFTALFQYDDISNSTPYFLVRHAQIFCLLWGILGVKLSISNCVDDVINCDAYHVVMLMHAQAVIWLMCVWINIVVLVVWILRRVGEMSLVHEPLLRLAKSIDDGLPYRMPIVMTVMSAMLFRHSADILHIKVQALKTDVQDLEHEYALAQAKEQKQKAAIDQRKQELDAIHEEELAALDQEKHMIERCKKQASETLEVLEPIFSFAAGRYDIEFAADFEEIAARAAEATTVSGGTASELGAGAKAVATTLGAAASDAATAAASEVAVVAAEGAASLNIAASGAATRATKAGQRSGYPQL